MFSSCIQFYLAAIPDHLTPAVQSAAAPYIRPVSQGDQVFTPDTNQFPVGQPITKLTAKLQVCVYSYGLVHHTLKHTFCTSNSQVYILCSIWHFLYMKLSSIHTCMYILYSFCTSHYQTYILCSILWKFLHIKLSSVHFVLYMPTHCSFKIFNFVTDLQASGEAQYTTDLPSLPNELAAAFVLTTQVSS